MGLESRRQEEEGRMGEQRKREGGIYRERGKEGELTKLSSSSIFLEVTLALSAFFYWPKEVNRCLDHFFIAVTKPQPKQHKERRVYLGLQCQRNRSP